MYTKGTQRQCLSQAEEDREGFREEVPGQGMCDFEPRLEREVGFLDFNHSINVI